MLQMYRRPKGYWNLTNVLDLVSAIGLILNAVVSIFFYPIAHAFGGEGEIDALQEGFQKAEYFNKFTFSFTVLLTTSKLIRYFGVYKDFRKLSSSLFSIIDDMIPY